MKEDQPEKKPATDLVPLALADDFETVWNVTMVGSLQCNKDSRVRAAAWIDKHHFMVALLTGVDLEPLAFEDPTGNPEAAKRNRLKMLHYYSISYTAYVIFCQRLKREQASKFKSDVSACVEDEVD